MARAHEQRCENCQEVIFTPNGVEPLLKITACRNCSVRSLAQSWELVCAHPQGGRYGDKKFAIAWLALDLPLYWDNGRSPSTYMEFDYFHENTGNRAIRPPTRIRMYKQHTVDALGNGVFCQQISFKDHFTREWTPAHGDWKATRDGRLELNFTHRGEGWCVFHNFIEIKHTIPNEVVFTAKKIEGEHVHDVYLMLDTHESGTGNWKESLPSTLNLYFNGCEDRTVLDQWHVI